MKPLISSFDEHDVLHELKRNLPAQELIFCSVYALLRDEKIDAILLKLKLGFAQTTCRPRQLPGILFHSFLPGVYRATGKTYLTPPEAQVELN